MMEAVDNIGLMWWFVVCKSLFDITEIINKLCISQEIDLNNPREKNRVCQTILYYMTMGYEWPYGKNVLRRAVRDAVNSYLESEHIYIVRVKRNPTLDIHKYGMLLNHAELEMKYKVKKKLEKDKGIILIFETNNDVLSFERIIKLDEYQVQDPTQYSNHFSTWYLVQNKKEPSYIFRAVTPEIKQKWLKALREAPDLPPPQPFERELSVKLWYVGEMSKDTAAAKLKQRENGTYMVRIRPPTGHPRLKDETNYALSIKADGVVINIRICKREVDGADLYYLSESRFFKSVVELVEYYERVSLAENFENLDQRLLCPYQLKKAGEAPAHDQPRVDNNDTPSNEEKRDEKLNFDEIEKAMISLNMSIKTVQERELIFSDVLGRGGQGVVCKGTFLGTPVAIKSMQRSDLKKLILREIKLLDNVRHPNIVSIMAVSFSLTQIHIVMEYFDSKCLWDVLFDREVNEKYALNVSNKNRIGYQLCLALAYLHLQNPAIIHRDIKPSNVLVNNHLVTKLCDLGLSKSKDLHPDLQSTKIGTIRGTYAYMAPEMIEQKEADTKSDMWAFACTLKELYTETLVWEGEGNNYESLKRILKNQKVPKLNRNVPSCLISILGQCFDYEADNRADIKQFLDAFKPLRPE